jgi:hypothetical protein
MILAKVLLGSVKCHFKVLCLFETKTFILRVVILFNAHFLENRIYNKLPVGLCGVVLWRLQWYQADPICT